MAVWTAAPRRLTVRLLGGGSAGQVVLVVNLLRAHGSSLSTADPGDAFLLGTILSFLLPLLPGAGLAWCRYRLLASRHQRCPWGCCRKDPSHSG